MSVWTSLVGSPIWIKCARSPLSYKVPRKNVLAGVGDTTIIEDSSRNRGKSWLKSRGIVACSFTTINYQIMSSWILAYMCLRPICLACHTFLSLTDLERTIYIGGISEMSWCFDVVSGKCRLSLMLVGFNVHFVRMLQRNLARQASSGIFRHLQASSPKFL